MSESRGIDLALAPDKRGGALVVCGGEIPDRLLQLLGAAKARAGQGLSGKDAEPDLHLIKPARRSRREVESDIRVLGKPSFVLLMGAVVVEDDVDLAVGGLVFNDLGHEGLEVEALFGLARIARKIAASSGECGLKPRSRRGSGHVPSRCFLLSDSAVRPAIH